MPSRKRRRSSVGRIAKVGRSREAIAAGLAAAASGAGETSAFREEVSPSMRHDIADDIYRERIGDSLRIFFEVFMVFALAFPPVAIVGVVETHHHDATFRVEDHAMVDL